MKLAHQMVVDSGLSVADDEECSTSFTHLHGFRRTKVTFSISVALRCSNSLLQLFPLLLQLVGKLEDALCLFHVALVASLLCLVHQTIDLLSQDLHLHLNLLLLSGRYSVCSELLSLIQHQSLL